MAAFIPPQASLPRPRTRVRPTPHPILALVAAFAVVPHVVRAQDWTMRPAPTPAALYGVAFSDANTWVAVGDGGAIARSTNGGIDWTAIASPVGDALRAVAFRGSLGLAVGVTGRVIRSTDAGLHWVQQARPTTRALYSVSMGDSFEVVTGEEGSIFVSTDDGVTWNPKTAGTASVLFGVSAKGAIAVAVGGQGAVAMSSGNGAAWGLTVIGDATTFFYGTSFATPTTGWAVGASASGSLIAKSTLSGITWSPQTAPTASTLTGVSFTSVDTGTAVGFGGTIVRTLDGGADWLAQNSHTLRNLNAVSFLDAQAGIAVGDSGTILRTATGGTVDVGPEPAPAAALLLPGAPNPFGRSTTMAFALPAAGFVQLKVYDLRGAEVATLASREMEPGMHAATLDARGLANGVYFARLEVRDDRRGAAAVRATQRLVVLH